MLFNSWKCKCLYTGHGNEDVHNTMAGTVLNTTFKENDFMLTISADMKVSEQWELQHRMENKCLD